MSSNHHVELSQNDLQKMKNSLVINGIIEQKELEKELIVPLMKDYVDSMTTGEDIHSGNIDKLPVNTRIKSLCRQEWQLEQAYNQYANHPADEDFANQYKAEWNAASLAYTLELKRLVDAYRINPGKVDLEKKARFDRLNKLLHSVPKPLRMEQNHSLDASNKVAKEEQRPAYDEQLKSKKEVETHIHPAETPAAVAEEKVNIEGTKVSDSNEYGRCRYQTSRKSPVLHRQRPGGRSQSLKSTQQRRSEDRYRTSAGWSASGCSCSRCRSSTRA
jgi:hypothetical protein